MAEFTNLVSDTSMFSNIPAIELVFIGAVSLWALGASALLCKFLRSESEKFGNRCTWPGGMNLTVREYEAIMKKWFSQKQVTKSTGQRVTVSEVSDKQKD